MPLELVNNTTKQGLFNRLKGLYTLIQDADVDASDSTSGYLSRVDFLYQRYTARPEPVEGASDSLKKSYADRFEAVHKLTKERAQSTIMRMVGDEYKILDNSLRKSLEFLIAHMVANNESFGRANTTISVSASPSNSGSVDVLVTDIVPTPGLFGLTDQSGQKKQCEKSSYVWNETLALLCTSSEMSSSPAKFAIEGDQQRDKARDWTWDEGGSGVLSTDITQYLVDTEQNLITNPSFESFTDTGITGWILRNQTAWQTRIAATTENKTHGAACLRFTGASTNYGDTALYQSVSLEPHRLYFIAFDVYATHNMPDNTKLRVSFYDDRNNPMNFYNASYEWTFGSSSGQIPENTTNFGLVYIPIVTDNTILTDRKYNIEIAIKLGTGETWPSGAKVFLDRLFLVRGIRLYEMGPYIAVLGSKPNPIKVGANWVITVSGNQMETWSWVFYHWFDIHKLGLHFPVSDTPTITYSGVA